MKGNPYFGVLWLLAWSSFCVASTPFNGTWRTIGTWQDPRGQVAQAVDPTTGRVYLLGGYDGNAVGSPVGTSESFDPTTGNWRTLAPMPDPVRGAAAVYDSGKIYVYVGVNPSFVLPNVQVYDIASNTWSMQSPNLMLSRYAPSAALLEGLHYLQGGEAFPRSLTTYDPTSGAIVHLPDAPDPHYAAGLVALGGKVWAFGGFTSPADPNSPVSAALDVYDPALGSWSSSPASMSVARGHFAYAADARYIYVAGGSSSYNETTAPYFDSVEFYDPADNVWRGGPNLPLPLREASAAISDSQLLVFGGINGSGASAGVFAISLPEPSALAPLALTATALLPRRRRLRFPTC